jgi:broad specificity phosphatase PhoE
MSPAPIYLLRHGETEWNTQRRMQGRLDSPLTALGRAQAEALGRTLRGHVDATSAIVSSPQAPALGTARLVATELGIEHIGTDERLCEMTWGEMDGHTIPEIEIKWPGQVAERRSRHWDYIPPGGESYAMVFERLASFVRELRQATRPTVVVSHGAVGRVIRGHYLSLPPPKIVALDEPQHIAYRLRDGDIAEIAGDQIALLSPSSPG